MRNATARLIEHNNDPTYPCPEISDSQLIRLSGANRCITTARPGASPDLIASRIERRRGSVWRYGDCSLEERSGSSWPGL